MEQMPCLYMITFTFLRWYKVHVQMYIHLSNKEFDEYKVIYNLHKINLEKFSTVFKQ